MRGFWPEKWMLKKLRVRDFLSIRDVDLALGKLNIVVGPPASGKSNLLGALALIGSCARFGYPRLEGLAGPDAAGGWFIDMASLAHNFDPSATPTLSVDVELGGGLCTYTLKLGLEGFEEELVRRGEVLLRSSSRDPSFTYTSSDGFPKTFSRAEAVELKVLYRDPLGRPRLVRARAHPSALSALPADAHPDLLAAAEELRGIRAFGFEASSLRKAASVGDRPDMGYGGEGLARLLLWLCLERRGDYEMLEKAVRGLVPEVEEVVPHIEGESVEVRVRWSGLRGTLGQAHLSEGTLRAIAVAAALYAGFSLVAIERPESCVHPRQLELLVALLRLASPQVVATTYSPQLLDYARPEEIIVVSRGAAGTVAERLAESERYKLVRDLLDSGGTLSEAWLSGLLGA